LPESTSKLKRSSLTAYGENGHALKAELERASADLLYSSESDRPFEFFSLAYPGRRSSPAAEDFARLVGADETVRVEERSLTDFFARHSATSDPYDSEAQKLRPRYEALMRLLTTRLRDVKVYRLGKIEVECYVLGLDGNDNLAGLKTVAVET
jgi:tRNA A37 N6-isopentenylltransferase MiaA